MGHQHRRRRQALNRLDPQPVIIATGCDFPDALSAGALAAQLDTLLLLVPADGTLPDPTRLFLEVNRDRFDQVLTIGGASGSRPSASRSRSRSASCSRVTVPSSRQRLKYQYTVCHGGRSCGSCRHAQPVRNT